jgi:anti-sigma factor RsiW
MRRRSQACLSDLKLDRWLAGELAEAEERVVEAHVEGCESCRDRRLELLAARRGFAAEAPPFAALGGSGSSPRVSGAPSDGRWRRGRAWQRTPWLLAAAALAAAAALVGIGEAWRAAPGRDGGGFGTRTKGSLARLDWVVRRGDRVFESRPDGPLRAGDAVRFSISAPEPVFVAILGLDQRGVPSVYHPEGNELSRVEAGNGQLLPAAIEIDASPAERLYGVYCSSPEPVARVKDAIARSPDAPALPEGCSSEHWTLLKESP